MAPYIGFGLHVGENGIEFILEEETSKKRPSKGKSLLAFPNKYTVIDIETTGLDPHFDSIIEIGALRIENGSITDSYSSLIKPDHKIDEFITELTGITNEMLESAPKINKVLPALKAFIGDSILIGHNVNFDINFLYDEFENILNESLVNDYVDTMRLSRRILPELKHHRLVDIADYYKIDTSGMHRAINDCKIVNECYINILQDIIKEFESTEAFVKSINAKHRLNTKNITTNNTNFDITNPLYGKECVFTGVLEKMPRKDAMQIVVDLGGFCGNGVTVKTNYLILGNNDYCPSIRDGKSNKHKKAEQLKLKGYDIEIISENVFYDMINLNIG